MGPVMKLTPEVSKITVLAIGLVLCLYRVNNIHEKEIAWDVLGYYLPLPATMVYDDPLLRDMRWLRKVNEKYQLTPTLYMVSSNDEGEPMYFFLMGMALFYAPFFVLGHVSCFLLGYPPDGFSPPYHVALAVGGVCYTLIGLFFFRRILRTYFGEVVSAAVLLVTVFSTNYIHHCTLKNLETVNILFMLLCIIVWYTIQWHRHQKLSQLIVIGAGCTLMALVKPSEVVVVILPLLWQVHSRDSLKDKIVLITRHAWQFVVVGVICILIATPQILYWLIRTGHPLYDSYKNPGIGLDFLSPHILESLFSYRKGWLLYTPVMLLYLLGLRSLYRENRRVFFPVVVYFFVAFYIIVSWTEWWYGAAFSNRPLIVTYPLLAIGFGYLLMGIRSSTWIRKLSFVLVLALCTALNQFQWWQLKHYVLDPYRMTKEYYWATFLKQSASDTDKKLLLVKRDFTGQMNFENREDYQVKYSKEIDLYAGRAEESHGASDEPGYLRIPADQKYALTEQMAYRELTSRDHAWVQFTLDVRYPGEVKGRWPYLVVTMQRRGGNYGYSATPLLPEKSAEDWTRFRIPYLTPEIRDRDDKFKYYIWKQDPILMDIDSLCMEVFEKKE